MFFSRKRAITCMQFVEIHSQIINDLVSMITSDLLKIIKKCNYSLARTNEDFEIEIAFFVNHILGKAMSQVKELSDPFTPEMNKISSEFVKKLYENYANSSSKYEEFDSFSKYILKRSAIYQQFEFAYSNLEIQREDFENSIVSLLLNTVDGKDIPIILRDKIVEYHQRIMITMFKTMENFSKTFKLLKEKRNDS